MRSSSLPLPPDDPTRRCPDIGLATRVLNWITRVALRDGLTHTIDRFRTGKTLGATGA